MALAQIALAGLTQYIDIKRLFERRLHPMAKKHHSVDVELQQPIHFMSDVSQIVTLVGHVGLFQTLISRQISSVEKNSTAIKQALTTCAGRAVVALLTSTAVAYPSFSRNTLRKPRGVSAPVSVDTRGVFRVEHAAPLRCVSPCYFPAPRRLLTALTPASTTAPMIKPSTRLATTGSVEAITPPNPALQCSMA